MIKKTIKKGLAFTLAASLAFGVAPVAGFAGPTVAEAASGDLSNTSSVSFTLGKTDKIYQTIKADKLAALVGAKATATVGDKEIIGLAKDADLKDDGDNPVTIDKLKDGTKNDGTKWAEKVENLEATDNINIKALKAGSTTITLKADDGAATTQVIDITVSEATKSITITDAKDKEIKEGDTINVVAGKTVTAKVTMEGMKSDISKLGDKSDTTKTGYMTDEKVIGVAYASNTFTFTGKEEGTARFSIYLKEDDQIVSFYVNVIAESELTTTIDDKVYKYDGTQWTCDEVVATPTVYMNPEADSYALSVASNNGKDVAYSTTDTEIVVDKTGAIAVRKDSDGKVTAGTYKVKVETVANETTGQAAIAGEINVVVSSKQANLVWIDITGSDSKKFAEAKVSVTGPDAYANGTATSDPLKLSLKDYTYEEFGIHSNVSEEFLEVKSSDETVVTVDSNGKINAVKKGTANVTFTAKAPAAFEPYTATITVPVEVSDKNVNGVIAADDIVLTETAPSKKIAATSTYNNTLSFPTLARKAVSTDPKAEREAGFHDYGSLGSEEQYDVTVNATTGEVTYKNNGKSGEIYVKVTGAANAESEAPEPHYVRVAYGKVEKKESDLKVESPIALIGIGDTDKILPVCSQKLTYSSDSPDVVSVDENGVVTAVSYGTAMITVTALADDTYMSGTAYVRVDVIEMEPQPTEKLANPLSAAGRTISTKAATLKKKVVKFTKAKAFKVNNAQGKVTFTKKSGNAKVIVSKGGIVKVKKGLKKGTYKIKVKVRAAGNDSYKAKNKTVTVTLKVK